MTAQRESTIRGQLIRGRVLHYYAGVELEFYPPENSESDICRCRQILPRERAGVVLAKEKNPLARTTPRSSRRSVN